MKCVLVEPYPLGPLQLVTEMPTAGEVVWQGEAETPVEALEQARAAGVGLYCYKNRWYREPLDPGVQQQVSKQVQAAFDALTAAVNDWLVLSPDAARYVALHRGRCAMVDDLVERLRVGWAAQRWEAGQEEESDAD